MLITAYLIPHLQFSSATGAGPVLSVGSTFKSIPFLF